MDSGCTNHMTGDKELFTEDNLTESSQKYITFGDNNKGKVIGLGKVAISKDKHIEGYACQVTWLQSHVNIKTM